MTYDDTKGTGVHTLRCGPAAPGSFGLTVRYRTRFELVCRWVDFTLAMPLVLLSLRRAR